LWFPIFNQPGSLGGNATTSTCSDAGRRACSAFGALGASIDFSTTWVWAFQIWWGQVVKGSNILVDIPAFKQGQVSEW